MQSRYAYLYEFDTEPKRAADAETLEKRLHPDIGQLADRSVLSLAQVIIMLYN